MDFAKASAIIFNQPFKVLGTGLMVPQRYSVVFLSSVVVVLFLCGRFSVKSSYLVYSIISYKMSADFNLDTFINEPSLQVVRTLKKSHLQPNHSKGTPVKPKSAGSAADGHKPRQFRGGSGGPICNYCKRRGHVISECWTLEQKRNNPPGDLLVSTVNPPNTRSAPPVKNSHEISSSTNYHPFVS